MFSKKSVILSASLLVGLAAIPSFGQNAGGNGGPGGNNGGGNNQNGGGGGGGQNGGRPDFRQQIADRMKEQLGMTDDEYTAIQPKIEAITTIQRSLQAGRMGMFGGGQGGRGGRQRGNNNGGGGNGGGGGGNNAGGGGGGGGGNNAGGGGGGNGGGGGGGGGGAMPAGGVGPGGGFGGQNDTSPIAVATKDLQTVTSNKDATPDDIKAKLQAYRDAKSKTKDELTKAQADLKELVSQKQEAVLVELGILE